MFHKTKDNGRIVATVDFINADNSYQAYVMINGNAGHIESFDNELDANDHAECLFDMAN